MSEVGSSTIPDAPGGQALVASGDSAAVIEHGGRHMGTRYRLSARQSQACIELALRQGWDIGALLAEAGISPTGYAQELCVISEEQASVLVRELVAHHWR